MKVIKFSFSMFLFTVIMVLMVGCNKQATTTNNPVSIGIQNKEQLFSIFDKYQNITNNYNLPETALGAQTDQSLDNSAPSADYSKTNTQVSGVDESDIVKTDGQSIFLPVENKVIIAKAYPVTDMNITKTITYDDGFYPNSLYVDDQYLVVIGTSYQMNKTNTSPYNYYYANSQSRIIIYDKSNYNTPKDVIDIDGYINTTRKVNNQLLIISNQYIYYNPQAKASFKLPTVDVNSTVHSLSYTDIHYNEGVYPGEFVSLFKFDLNNLDNFHQYTYLGSSSNVYVSLNNVYIAQNVYPNYPILYAVPGNVEVGSSQGSSGSADSNPPTTGDNNTSSSTTTTDVTTILKQILMVAHQQLIILQLHKQIL